MRPAQSVVSFPLNLSDPIPMSLHTEIADQLKDAMRAKDAVAMNTLRALKSALKYAAIEKLGAHRRPLLTGSLQRGLRGDGKRNAFMFMMLVATHRAYLSFYRPSGKLGTQPDSVRGPAVKIMPQREQANAHQREQRLATAIMR